MNKIEETEPNDQWREARRGKEGAVEGKQAGLEEGVPLSVRKAREMRRSLWPDLWILSAATIILIVTLAILSYRIGAQSCH
jgi:hypothetical protein